MRSKPYLSSTLYDFGSGPGPEDVISSDVAEGVIDVTGADSRAWGLPRLIWV